MDGEIGMGTGDKPGMSKVSGYLHDRLGSGLNPYLAPRKSNGVLQLLPRK